MPAAIAAPGQRHLAGPRLAWILGLLAALCAAAGWVGYTRVSRKPPPRYEAAVVDRGAVVARVTATGVVSPLVTVLVGSQVSGRVVQLFVDFNDPVHKGQVLAKIDPALFQAALEQARANVDAARANLAKAKAQAVDAHRTRDRNKVLVEGQLIAQGDFDTSDANARVADAQVAASVGALEQADAALHQAQVNLGYTTIVSPVDGTVIQRAVDVGQTVAASLQAPTIFTIAEDLTKMQVDTSVAEADVGKLRQGMGATFTVDAYPNDVFQGTVRQIRNAPQTVQNVVTYDAVIDVANADLRLMPGMTATATFVYASRDSVLRVPNAALRFTPPGAPAEAAPPVAAPDGGATPHSDRRAMTLWVLRGVEPTRVAVTIGVSDGALSEVVGGDVREGERVVTDLAAGAAGPRSGSSPLRGF